MRQRLVALLLLLATGLAWADDPFASKIADPLAPTELLALLRGGGNVIYFRHAATTNTSDQGTARLGDCSTQRNLSDEGRDQARAIGAAFKRLGIAVDAVLASPMCRTLDTARLAFGRVEASTDLFSRGQPKEPDDRARAELLRERLGTPPAPGQNTVLVSHGSPFHAVAGEFLNEGEAGIARPDGGGRFRLVARVRAGQWDEWYPAAR